MEPLYWTAAAVGAGGFLLALGSRWIRQRPLSEPLLALLAGVVLGPAALGLVVVPDDLRDPLLLEGSRFLLAWSVMAAALRFSASSLRGVLAPVAVLLVVVMPVAAALSAVSALVLGLPLVLAAVVGACLSPTDPVLAASVVSGESAERDLPARLRAVLTAESGANDGLGLPLVGLALAAALPAQGWGAAVGDLAWEVLGGSAIGLVLGAAAGWSLRSAAGRRSLSRGPELVVTLLLALGVLGVGRLAGTDGVLAVFVAGLAYNRLVAGSERAPQDGIDEAVNRYAVLPLFLLLGAVLPWAQWAAFGPLAVIFVVGVLVVRRLPVLLALHRPLGLARRDAAFAGWFGPMGVSAVFYLAHSAEEGVTDPRVFAAGALAVTASALAAGVSASPLRRRYAAARQG